MLYRKLPHYKYQMLSPYTYELPKAFAGLSANTTYLHLENRRLTIRSGYAWDGPSGPTIDTKTFMRGSLIHDALYQLIAEGYLSTKLRIAADQILRDVCQDDGMNPIRATYVYWAVRWFGGFHMQLRNHKRSKVYRLL
jgi:hypothetical protein